MFWYTLLSYLAFASGQLNENKDQYCVDPRTFKKHAANTEWADAYSCTRHKCQLSGRKLAMYTVGCKRVEKPESAIECEDVVEDTNMQFPYCCTRLRCLVVVQGEVWTKVLGQPWETLPTAPWSHMYKKKKPPPSDEKLPKPKDEQGPVFELHTDLMDEPKRALKKNILRMQSFKNTVIKPKPTSDADIIALTSDNEENRIKGHRSSGSKRINQVNNFDSEYDFDKEREIDDNEVNEKKRHPWSRIPPKRWSEQEAFDETDTELPPEKKVEGSDLQSLVDAIETRMRDIEDVVQRMNHNIVSKNPENIERRYESESNEKREHILMDQNYHDEENNKTDFDFHGRHKTENKDAEYLHIAEDIATEADLSNSIFKKLYTEKYEDKEPMLTYIMAPVDNSRKSNKMSSFEKSKHMKHTRRTKGKSKKHRKHHNKKETKKHSHKHSTESEKDILSFEDSIETPIY
ncbi:myosin heavy chain, striated muscle-like isoform X2 [Aricia agestis]|uniref:myosin heavy chain, striated muscle-like isoform X2 n=1 Tax=Aricia agestis TaxID=91739 RepID=UPI001C2092C9|nr:myosin heavy chain, striated muscle-like isoform X2 [Aricia agestis]